MSRQSLTGIAHKDVLAVTRSLTGTRFVDKITGTTGNDIIEGGASGDKLCGGDGVDTLTYAHSAAAVTVDLQTGRASGGDAQGDVFRCFENLQGSTYADRLYGNEVDNVLDGLAGADLLAGRGGDDTYIVDNAGDRVIEQAGEGDDLVRASVSHTLSANVERLQLDGRANLNGNGNSLDNVITGNSGNNRLDGGLGADTLIGGRGDDTYLIDGLEDRVIELQGEGNDTLTGGGGDDRFVFDYNSDADTITDFTVHEKAGATITAHDLIDISRYVGPYDITAGNFGSHVSIALAANGKDTLITIWDHATITLKGVAPASVSIDDFIL